MKGHLKQETIFDYTNDLSIINKVLGLSSKSISEAKEEYESGDIIPPLNIYPPADIFAYAIEIGDDRIIKHLKDEYGELPKDVYDGKVGFE